MQAAASTCASSVQRGIPPLPPSRWHEHLGRPPRTRGRRRKRADSRSLSPDGTQVPQASPPAGTQQVLQQQPLVPPVHAAQPADPPITDDVSPDAAPGLAASSVADPPAGAPLASPGDAGPRSHDRSTDDAGHVASAMGGLESYGFMARPTAKDGPYGPSGHLMARSSPADGAARPKDLLDYSRFDGIVDLLDDDRTAGGYDDPPAGAGCATPG